MKLSSEQLERLAERVFKVLKGSGHIELDYDTEERIEEKVIEQISNVLEDDSRTEDRLSREAERLVSAQSQIAKSSGKSFESLVEEVKVRLARSKRVILGDEPERADSLAEKVLKAIWKIDGIDFFSEDMKVQNCIARAIHRFRVEDDRIIEAVEKIVNKKSGEESYSHAWCIAFDRCYNEVRQRIANQKSSDETTTVGG
ncbi:DUF507 family protein [Fluviispira multicolorata]|uniref:DUF507 family protein n=1 Tax=Fluviispira multicolorata TaxID=2654512 RepID=A0A833JBB1_9BACT|nr:DUF507 family protein [Fluviispira multicolorata]KAB8029112.1 DUF507 family protein [Fluviispira multicolorata]